MIGLTPKIITALVTIIFCSACGTPPTVVSTNGSASQAQPPSARGELQFKAPTGWISERDLQQLYVRSIEANSVADPDGVPFQIFYGVSGNARTFWSIANARRVIGYVPEDDSEIEFADEIAAMTRRAGS